MRILAIETSCDETAASVVEDGKTIISNVVASSSDLHEKTGGIIPEIAAREQVKCIIPVITEALNPLNKSYVDNYLNIIKEKIDAIAVTIGPGLNGSLLVGIEAAKTIAYVTHKPLIPVNHVFAHIYANCLNPSKPIIFPGIALVVSGGHTELFLMKSYQELHWIGGTRDDACGEAFDKTARLLGLGFPGGPAIAAEAAKFQISNFKFQIKKLPRPMMDEDTLDFSFSGLKTAVMREVNKLKSNKQFKKSKIQQLSYELQEAITDVLVNKTLRASRKYKVKSILLGGGVAANKRLSEKMNMGINNLKLKIDLYIPPPSLCTDNAAYIASYAYFHNQPLSWQKTQTQPNLKVNSG